MGWFETLTELGGREEEEQSALAPTPKVVTVPPPPIAAVAAAAEKQMTQATKRPAPHSSALQKEEEEGGDEVLEPPTKSKPPPPSFPETLPEPAFTVKDFFANLQAMRIANGTQVLPPNELLQVIKHTCTLVYSDASLRAKLGGDREWHTLMERLLADFDWRGLGIVLGLARHESAAWFPAVWLPLVYQTCSRLVRDPSSSPGGADSFRSGAAFRDHPSAFFDIGRRGGLRLVQSRWGKLRGYSFCAWVNLHKSTSPAPRQLFRFGNASVSGAAVECYVQENSTGAFQFHLRSRPSSSVGWSTLEAPALLALNRWHFIVVAHARPYLLGKPKLTIFVDGVQQCASALPFPNLAKEGVDDCVLGFGLDGYLGSPTLFEGGDVNATEAMLLCDRTRIRVDTPHVVGEAEDDHDVDGEDDEITNGLGFGQADARDLHVDAREMLREIVTRVGVQHNGELKRMIFSFDPRAANADGYCPELVIRGIMRGRLDALELAPASAEDAAVNGSASLVEDEHENDARLEGECSVRVENSTRRDCVELAGGCRALLMSVADAPRSAFGDALMFLGDALHADSHLRSSFLASEGFELIGRAIRERFYEQEANEEDVVLVQVALHMMRAAPAKSALEQRFINAGLKELLLDARVSQQRACQTLRLVSGLAAENPSCVRQAVGVEGVLKFMWRLEAFPDSQTEVVTEVLHHVWGTVAPGESLQVPGPTSSELAHVFGFIAEHPASAGSRALVREITDLVRATNVPTLRALTTLGGVSFLLRLGCFTEANVKNAETGMIIKNPEPGPSLLGTSETPAETRCALIELLGLLIRKRASACIPLDPENPLLPGLIDSEAIDNDMVVQLGHLLGTIHSAEYSERDDTVVKCLLDALPKPHGFFVWAVPAVTAEDVKGMTRVAENLQKNAALAKAMLNLKGWPSCFAMAALQEPRGALAEAAMQCIKAILVRAEDARHVDVLVATTPPIIWSQVVRHLVENSYADVPAPVLIRALATARRTDMLGAFDKDFVLKSLFVCDQHLRNGGHWQSAWALILHVLPSTEEVDVAETCVRLGLSITSKELAKTAHTSETKKRVMQLLKMLNGTFDQGRGGAGQLRAEMGLGLVQNFPLTDDVPAFQRYVQDCLEASGTIPQAISLVIDSLPNTVTVNDNLDHQVKSNSVVHEPAVVTASRQTSAYSAKLRAYMKKRAVEQVRDQLAFRVTERVRDRRFDARWEQLRSEDDVERRAWRAETRAFKMDESFCERGSRVRRRLLHPSETDLTKMRSVVSRSLVMSKEDAREEEAALRIGEEVSRATQIKTHSDLDEGEDVASAAAAAAGLPPTPRNESGEDGSNAPPLATAVAAPAVAPSADAKAKKMTLQEWVNRPPLSIRGELDGRWIDASAGERIILAARAFIVRVDGECAGRLIVSNFALYFDPDPPGSAGNYFESASEQEEAPPSSQDESKDRFEPRQRWSLMGVQRVLLRRHRMMESGIEVFMRGDANKSVFLRFQDVNNKSRKAVRDRVVRTLLPLLPRSARDRSQSTGRNAVRPLVDAATLQWKLGAMSNFDYLMELNTLAGRSVHDLCQYPVFPWVLSDYKSQVLDLDNPASYRDLSKPMGALLPERLEQYVERYETFDDPTIPKFHYGSHYSTAAGTALHFLVRIEPFRSLHVEMHDNRYDVPDRLFTSVAHSWDSSYSSQDLGEVKELTSEFYSLPAMFENRGEIDLGESQHGHKVGPVALPPWANQSAHEFVRQMRAALESQITSSNLHQWIDLVFGFKQRGEQAVLAHNVFFYLTYPGAVDLESMEDANMRRAVEHQIAHFGQCPEQLESRNAWPARTYVPPKPERFVLRPRSNVEVAFSVDRDIPLLHARIVMRKPIASIPAEDAEEDDGGGGGLLCLGADGAITQLVASEVSEKDSQRGGNSSGAGGVEHRGVRQPCVWSADGTLLISASRAAQGTVELVQLGGVVGDALAKATLFAHDERITCIAYDDGLLLTGAGDGAIRLWRVGHAGALRRTTVWTRPRKFLCGHAIGQPIVCAAVQRSMGVAAAASVATGLLVHDMCSGALLFRIPHFTHASRMLWDSASGSLCVLFADHSLAVVSVDGQVLRQTKPEAAAAGGGIVCLERIAPSTVALSRGSSVEVLELPSLTMLQSWPLPDVCAITPSGEEHVVVNLVTTSRTVFVLRRSFPLSQQSAFKVLREAPTAVVGAVSSAVSSRVNFVGALDKVRTGVEVGKGVSGEAWEAFSNVTGGFFGGGGSSGSKKE